MISISNDTLKMALHVPDGENGYYRGTRFDWAGVFAGIEYQGCNYAEPWFENYYPQMHDAVCGPAEEFSPVGIDEAAPGDPFLKIGVGLLARQEGEYDRFRLHDIIDAGSRRFRVMDDSVVFSHFLDTDTGYAYEYIKEIRITGKDSFRIAHKLLNKGTKVLEGDVYNHNFFTLGLLETGSSRRLDFPYVPDGDWRSDYAEVGFTDAGIRFSRTLHKGESVYTGNLHEAGKGLWGSPNSFRLFEDRTGRGVEARCEEPMMKAVFWANHRIACMEPYVGFYAAPGQIFTFDIDYQLF